MSTKGLESIRHDYLRYANCWEDAEVLLSALQVAPGDQVLSIGSAGDNAFSLLTGDPERIVAVDINAVQIHLIELKKAAFLGLSHLEFLHFLGFQEGEDRLGLFQRIKKHLPKASLSFWEVHESLILGGVIHQGKFERYFQFFYRKLLPFIHSKKRIAQLLEPKSPAAQVAFFQVKWNNLAWRLLFRVFFSRYVMGKYGRDPAFLREVQGSVSDRIREKTIRHLESVDCQQNYFLSYILGGNFDSVLPHYARPEHFEAIRGRVDRLETVLGKVEDSFRLECKFTKFNLSNIFEYMSLKDFTTITQEFEQNSGPRAMFAYWNLMVPRRMSTVSDGFTYQDESSRLAAHDKGFFYGDFVKEVRV